ncbi:MAG TPA: C45 family peptidase, partial [Nitrolancea sp.]|nr:C45 family peptidase [Nitrolancea sp.]
GLDWPEVLDQAADFAGLIRDFDTNIFTEISGIADGAGVRLNEIVAINCRTEILFGGRGRIREDQSASECTTIAVTPRASATGSTILAKNWDWRAPCQETVIILQAQQDEAPNFVMLVEAGMVGRDGFNDAGIAVCGNLLRSTLDGSKAGLPVPFIRRRVLNSARLDRAMGEILNAERAASTNYIIAHESGMIVDFEASPDQVYPVYPENGLLTHSNHFTAVAAQVHGIGLLTSPDTLYRMHQARELLEPKIGLIGVEDVKAALRDHVGYPQAICRHPDPDLPESRQSMSIASIIIDLGNREMHVAGGPPCCHDYQTIGLPRSSAASESAAQPSSYARTAAHG